MQNFAKPWYKKRNLEIFRDETSLSASPHLWKNITKALDQSEYLILLGSPSSEKSKWVNKEVKYWLEHKSIETILIALTEGEIEWDDNNNCFLKPDENSLPPALDDQFSNEPFYIDLRQSKTEEDVSLNNSIFKKEILTLAAKLHNKKPNDLASEEVTTYRKMLRLRNSVFFILITLLILSIYQTREARSQGRIAEARLRRSESNLLITRSNAMSEKAPDIALSLAMDGWELDKENPIAHQAVLRSYYTPDAFPIHLLKKDLPGQIGAIISFYAKAFDKDSKSVWVVDHANPKKLIRVSLNGEPSDLLLTKSVYDFRLDPIGDGFLTVNNSGATLWDGQGNIIHEYPYLGATFATISKEGSRIMIAGDSKGAALILNREGKLIARLCCHGNNISHGDFADSDRGLISTAGDNETRVWNSKGELKYTIEHEDYVTSSTISPNGEFVATTTWDSRVQIWWLETGKLLKNLPGHSSRVYSANFSPNGKKLVTASWDGTIRVWDARSLSTRALLTLPTVEGQDLVVWSDDGNWLVASGSKTVTLWNITMPKHLPLNSSAQNQVKAEGLSLDHFELKGDYRDVSVIKDGQNFFTFEIPFHDQIYQGKFTEDGQFIDVFGYRRFPFSPKAIDDLVYTQLRFGNLVRQPKE